MARSSLEPSAILAITLLSLADSLSAAGVPVSYPSPSNVLTVRTAVGKTVVLTCPLPGTGDNQITWAQKSADNILVAHKRNSPQLFGRLEAFCSKHSDHCLLTINNVQRSDSGLYVCLVDSTPPVEHAFYLSVSEPTVTILGEPFRTHWQGSAINLTCVVRPPPGPTDSLVWLHGDSILYPYLDSRISMPIIVDNSMISTMMLEDAEPGDSGKYTCRLTSGSSDSVDVDVMEVVRDDSSPAMSGAQRPLAGILLVVAAASSCHSC